MLAFANQIKSTRSKEDRIYRIKDYIKNIWTVRKYFIDEKNAVLKEIKKLNSNKAVQDTDIPVKILKENAEFFAEYIYLQFNETIESPKFPDFFKFANITPAFK